MEIIVWENLENILEEIPGPVGVTNARMTLLRTP